MGHLLIEGAAAIVLVIAGGFFLVASWRARGTGVAVVPFAASRASTASLVGVPVAGILLIVLLILLANTFGQPPRQGHGPHGVGPGQPVAPGSAGLSWVPPARG